MAESSCAFAFSLSAFFSGGDAFYKCVNVMGRLLTEMLEIGRLRSWVGIRQVS